MAEKTAQQQQTDGQPQQTDRFGRVFKIKDDLRQKHYAEWNGVYLQMPRLGVAQVRQAALQASIVAGWIESPETRVEKTIDLGTGKETTRYWFDGVEVGELRGTEVSYYGQILDALFDEEYAIPNG